MSTKKVADQSAEQSAEKTAEQTAEQTAQVAAVTKELESIAEALQKQLAELNKKKQLADSRELFLSNRENLLQYLVELSEESNETCFESKRVKIMFQSKHAYREDSIFSISHPALILSFVQNLISEIDKKVRDLEKQLIA